MVLAAWLVVLTFWSIIVINPYMALRKPKIFVEVYYQYPPPAVLAGLIISRPLVDFVLHMVIITLQQAVGEKISLLKELMNPDNRPELNNTYQIQIDAIRSAANDLEYVEPLIKQKKELLKNSKDVKETDRLLAELDALE